MNARERAESFEKVAGDCRTPSDFVDALEKVIRKAESRAVDLCAEAAVDCLETITRHPPSKTAPAKVMRGWVIVDGNHRCKQKGKATPPAS